MMEKQGFEMEAEALAICPWEGLAVTEHKASPSRTSLTRSGTVRALEKVGKRCLYMTSLFFNLSGFAGAMGVTGRMLIL